MADHEFQTSVGHLPSFSLFLILPPYFLSSFSPTARILEEGGMPPPPTPTLDPHLLSNRKETKHASADAARAWHESFLSFLPPKTALKKRLVLHSCLPLRRLHGRRHDTIVESHAGVAVFLGTTWWSRPTTSSVDYVFIIKICSI